MADLSESIRALEAERAAEQRTKDGGSAFPFAIPELFVAAEAGMSLRDWFAGQALTGIYASNWFTDHADRNLVSRDSPHEVEADDAAAARAYKVADAMLRERAKGGQ